VRQDQDSSEIIDVARRTTGPGRLPGDAGSTEINLKLGCAEDAEATDTHESNESHESHADFNRNFDRIFLTGKR
jgi:hypothetical protein